MMKVATNVFTPLLNGIPSISRETAVDVNPLGPVQFHVPPSGAGPRFTVDPEATVAMAVCCHAPPFTCKYGVIGVGAQVGLPMVNAIAVLAVRLPEVPIMVTVDVPTGAELLTTSVAALDDVVGLVPNDAVTPVGRPEAARVTVPLNPPTSATVIVLVPLLPGLIVRVVGAGASVKLSAGAPKVTTTLAATLGTPCAFKANNQ